MRGDPFVPHPRAELTVPKLTRPDWTEEVPRDPNRLWLDKNENADPLMSALVARTVCEVAKRAVFTYPESGSLYRKLAAHLNVTPANICLAHGSDGVIRGVYEAFVTPGDTVVRTEPTFAMYTVYGQIRGAKDIALQYRSTNAGPILSVDDVRDAIALARPRLVCLPNPDSPTGTAFPPDELKAIVAAARDAGAVMLIDEAYHPFYAPTAVPWIDEFPNLVIARSTGKAWGMAGLRIGYAVGGRDLTTFLHKVRPMYETSTLAAMAFERLLDHEEAMLASVARLEDGKRGFLEAMQRFGFQTLATHGNFLHVAFGKAEGRIHAALEPLVYYRRGFAQTCLSGYSRFSCTTPDRFAPLIEHIGHVLDHGE